MKIGTHNGSFHPDDVFAIAALLLVYPNTEIIRSRDKEILSQCDILVDVGGKYNPNKGFFDHHQEDFKLKRPNKIPYSSFGLVWMEYGLTICLGFKEIFESIDLNLVQCIDANDNGERYCDLEKTDEGYSVTNIRCYNQNGNPILNNNIGSLISSYNPTWVSNVSHDRAFEKAVQVAKSYLTNLIEQQLGTLQADPIIRKMVPILKGNVLILGKFMPWQKTVLDAFPNVKFVVYRDPNDTWIAQCVPTVLNGFKCKMAFPTEWGGLVEQQLDAAIGTKGSVFCHKKWFIFGHTDHNELLKILQEVLKRNGYHV
jgi:uncharacterized UPF0160 family protein